MKELPYGISDYEKLIESNCYYIDKTKYIEQLEIPSNSYVMFLRPRKFGKTLFTSTLENYYDVNKKDKFEGLFKDTYIGKNPTEMKNSYYILRFNFAGMDTSNAEMAIKAFRNRTVAVIRKFVQQNNMDFYISEEQEAEDVLDNLFKAFQIQKPNRKIYVIIDEYDHFANELLSFQTEEFKNVISKNGKVRKWYEILKEGTESVVDRIFITGVAPITLDSMTSGFNIISDLTRDPRFNEMMGFTEEELIKIMEDQEIDKKKQEELLPIMKENYDGYRFSIDAKENKNLYNSTMCLYFLNSYISFGKIPEELVDTNIASDYRKIGNMLKLCKNENRLDIIEKTVTGEGIGVNLVRQFNPEMDFEEREMVSLLYYLGYLTIVGEDIGDPILKVPNQVLKDIYAEYFLKVLREEGNFEVYNDYNEIAKEMLKEGKVDKILNLLREYLENLSNRDYQNFSEKYIKLMFYCMARSTKKFIVKSELELGRRYCDILLLPKDADKGYYSIMIEFKYLKKGSRRNIQKAQEEAKEQIVEYSNKEEMKIVKNLKKYTVVAVVDKIYVEEI